jgi:hypothetical protein
VPKWHGQSGHLPIGSTCHWHSSQSLHSSPAHRRTADRPLVPDRGWRMRENNGSKDEKGTEISWTEPHRFLYLIWSNAYFLVRLYRFRFRISDVSYFKCKSRKRFRHFFWPFSTFLLLIWNIPNSKFGQLHMSYNSIIGCSPRSCVLSTGGQLSSLIDGAQPHLPSPQEVVLNGKKTAASTRKLTWAIAYQAHRFNPHLQSQSFDSFFASVE